MQFKYRQVAYGTDFVPVRDAPRTGVRSDWEEHEKECSEDSARLYANELVVDVGGTCWGHKGETRAILDHHFFRDDGGQFPSAAAAVLHNTHRIWDRFHAIEGGVLWLVTHANPDFDAFCALHLARRIFEPGPADEPDPVAPADKPAKPPDPDGPATTVPHEGWADLGLNEDGWFGGKKEIDWYRPRALGLPPARRWPILLAAYAACVDNCRRLACPKERSLHSVLYAALKRGRSYFAGAEEFFDEVRRFLVEKRLHPLFDSVLEGSALFAPELRLLNQEVAAYERDLRAARRTLVYVRKADDFGAWFPEVQRRPLFDDAGAPSRAHLLEGQQAVLADGICVRDPECLLFKEWARNDTENSSMGAGFLFTAVARSGGRPGAHANDTDYYFALDPELARGRHLYNVWARLQIEDMKALDALSTKPDPSGKPPRFRFEERAEGKYRPYFDDPWFDGANYKCTIVPTPNRGTFIRPDPEMPGTARDLSDDRVARAVREELEYAVYESDLAVRDESADHKVLPPLVFEDEFPISEKARAVSADEMGCYRFGRVFLDDGVNVLAGDVAEHIGRELWRHLNPEDGDGVPDDFLQRHVLRSADWVGVWSRRGVAVACKKCPPGTADKWQELFSALTTLSRELGSLTELMDKAAAAATQKEREEQTETALKKGEEGLRRVAAAKRALARPENRLLGHFFEASQLDEVLKTLRDVYLAAVERAQTERLNKTTREVVQVQVEMNTNTEEVVKLQGEMSHNTAKVVALQAKLEWVEIFIVGVYALELAYHVGHVFHFPDQYLGWGVMAMAAAAMALAYWLLRPFEHAGASWTRQLGILLLIVVLFGGYLFGGKVARDGWPGAATPAATGPPGEATPAAGAGPE